VTKKYKPDEPAKPDGHAKTEERNETVAPVFKVDPRNFPGFDQAAFEARVQDALPETFKPDPDNESSTLAAIKGILLVDGHSLSTGDTLRRAVRTAIREAEDTTVDGIGVTVSNTDIYARAVDVIPTLDGHEGQPIFFEMLVAAARAVFQNASRLAFDDDGKGLVASQIERAVEDYATTGGVARGLDLADLVAPDEQEEIFAANVQSVAVIYAAHQLEQARLFDVVDRILELFMNGMLPVGFDQAGKALDNLYFLSDERYDKAARLMQYSRVLGAPGGDVSTEVAPNAEFEPLWMRFLGSIAEFERQRRLTDLFDNVGGERRSAATTTEHIRKAGRDLAANASLYGWANTHFAARRLTEDINRLIGILRLPEIQNSYGVQTLWQVIERVATTELGAAPNVVRYRTLADSGKRVLDLVAKHAKVWTALSTRPLFDFEDVASPSVSTADIPRVDRDELILHAEAILAVMGIKDAQVDQYAEPAESALAPSIPSVTGPVSGNGAGVEEQLRQLIAGGPPNMDDLRRLAGLDA
jgi:hypothetical protein